MTWYQYHFLPMCHSKSLQVSHGCSSLLALLNCEVLGHCQLVSLLWKGRGRAVVVRQQSMARPARKSSSVEHEKVGVGRTPGLVVPLTV